MNTKKTKHTPGPGVKDIIQAISSEALTDILETSSMELDWSDTPDQVRDELEQEAGQVIRAAPKMAERIERLEADNAELLEALEGLQVEAWKHRTGKVKKDFSLLMADSIARAAIRKAKGDK